MGPEILGKLLADPACHQWADIEVMADPGVLAAGGVPAAATAGYRLLPFSPEAEAPIEPGQATAAAGRECLAALSRAAQRLRDGEADGLVFAPLNKQALHLGGLAQADEMRFLAHELGHDGACGELNVLAELWTTRVTSHIPLADVAGRITPGSVGQTIRFAHDSLVAAGRPAPRIAVAALNPHAGDGGNFGREEIEVIEPAVRRAVDDGIAAEGPFPSDTVFVRARDGAFDCVVTMFHDQGQIAMKLLGFGQGVTVLGGLPLPITTCGHGTAYDIVGTGQATDGALRNALRICAAMAGNNQNGSAR
ncbi:MAG: 4-hydroxythreonine-4-phosphate dehydrogenase PdxA [Alphaproteobacteria bacterium]|nr:4-hydroxythreonine-4-phosphate dehydrogenase PdxA [Alphaproteobacteria bacterium]